MHHDSIDRYAGGESLLHRLDARAKLLAALAYTAAAVSESRREVACLLMDRLAAFGRARNARIVVLAQPQEASPPPDQVEVKDGTLACARAKSLATLDLFPVLDRMTPEQRAPLFQNHMTAEGNRVVAEELSRFLGAVPSAPA